MFDRSSWSGWRLYASTYTGPASPLTHLVTLFSVSCGAHNSVVVLSRGDRLARFMPHLRLMRVKVMPIMLGLPWGISFGLPTLPMPARITTQVGPDGDLGARFGPEAADDDEVVQAIYDEVTSLMQRTMDGLVAEREEAPALAS